MPLHRLRRERPSRELAAFLRIFNSAGVVLWSCDAQGACTYMSGAWRELSGHPVKGVVGDSWQKHVEPADLQRVWPQFDQALRQRQPLTVEYRLRRADGTLRWVRDHGAPVFASGRFQGFVGTLIDIDERRRLEDRLRDANERFSLAIGGTSDGIWDWAPQTDRAYLSGRGHDLLGYPHGYFDSWSRFLPLLHPADRPMVEASLQRHLRERTPYHVECRLRSPAGRYRWIEIRGQAEWDGQGCPVRMAGSVGEISQRKRAERRIQLLNQRLTQRNDALRRQGEMLGALAQRLIDVGEEERKRVARDLHDDLNQKVAYLQMQIAYLAKSTPSLQAPLGKLETLAESLAEDVRRVARDLHSSVLDHLGLERALRSYCADFSSRNALAITFLRKGRGKEPPPAAGLCVYRVAQEAIRNAARHSSSPTATVTLSSTATSVTVRVEDAGCGFHPSQAGIGLGLTSMSERVRLAGGSFRLVTRPGKGTLVEAVLDWRK